MDDESFRDLFCMILALCYETGNEDPEGQSKMLDRIFQEMKRHQKKAKRRERK